MNRFKQSFQYTITPLFSYRRKVGTTFHFPLSCSNYPDERLAPLNKIKNINLNILENSTCQFTKFLLYGKKDFTASFDFILFKLSYWIHTAYQKIWQNHFFWNDFSYFWYGVFFYFMILCTSFCSHNIVNIYFLLELLNFYLPPRYDSIFLPGDCKFSRSFCVNVYYRKK